MNLARSAGEPGSVVPARSASRARILGSASAAFTSLFSVSTMPIGVFRSVDAPCFDAAVHEQIAQVVAKKGKGDLKKLLYSGDVWEVR